MKFKKHTGTTPLKEGDDNISWESKQPFWLLKKSKALSEKLKANILSADTFSSHIFIASSGSLSGEEIKIMALSKKALLLSAKVVNKHLQITEEDRLLSVLSPYHVADLAVKARAYVSGATLVSKKIVQPWSPTHFVNLLKQENISVTSLVPAQVFDLITKNIVCPKNVRLVIVGGSALSAELCYKALQLGWPIISTYGMTELCSQVATASLKDLKTLQKAVLKKETNEEDIKKAVQSYVTCWKLLPHINAKVNQENLYLQSDALLSAEFIVKNNTLITKKEYTNQEWFLTQDHAILQDRKLYFKSKGWGKIKIKSKLVFLKELNSLLEDLNLHNNLNLKNIYLFPKEHIKEGFRLVLISECSNISTKNTSILVSAFNNKVQSHEKVRCIYYLPTIPKTDLGKLRVEAIKPLLQLGKK
ncbi:MAG: AMP-binding protein [Bdellovibrionaceae bacterium]|nr:AMP-binding protein [Pseudobdellovibrionaceae bacterium]